MAGYTMPVPSEYDADVAFVATDDELTWLRLFHDLLADPARLTSIEPLDPNLLLGFTMDGWWQTAARQRERPLSPHG